jgi:PIN domain nuclease of toxin-antitoxin system
MRLLLDTHTLLWWMTNDAHLSPKARAMILDDGNEVFVSAVCAWEISTKHRLGKLPEARDAAPRYLELVDADGFTHLPVSPRHALRAGAYAVKHGDPFDRMLAAQAELEGFVLVTRDPAFAMFPVQVLW